MATTASTANTAETASQRGAGRNVAACAPSPRPAFTSPDAALAAEKDLIDTMLRCVSPVGFLKEKRILESQEDSF